MSVAGGVVALTGATLLFILGWRWRLSPESVDPNGWAARSVSVHLRAFRRSSGDSGLLTVDEIRSYATVLLISAACIAGLGIAEIAWALSDSGF